MSASAAASDRWVSRKWAAVRDQPGDALGWVVRFDGHIATVRLEYRVHGSQHVRGAQEAHGDRDVGAQVQLAKGPGETRGTRVQLRVAQSGALVRGGGPGDGRTLRREGDLPGEQAGQRGPARQGTYAPFAEVSGSWCAGSVSRGSRATVAPGASAAALSADRSVSETISSQHISRAVDSTCVESVRARPADFSSPFSRAATRDVVQHAQPGVRLNQPVPELRKHGEVEARITQIQAEGVLEVDPGPDRFGGLPVGQALDELQHQDQRQAAR